MKIIAAEEKSTIPIGRDTNGNINLSDFLKLPNRVELKYQGDKQRMSEKNILEEIAEKTRERIRKEKRQFPLDQLKTLAEKAPQQPSFLEALKKAGYVLHL